MRKEYPVEKFSGIFCAFHSKQRSFDILELMKKQAEEAAGGRKMVNKKLLEIGDRLGMKYSQIEMLNNKFRRDFRFLIFMFLMAGVLFYMNVVGQKAPQVLSMADLGYTEEIVESKQVNTDGRNDQRYWLSLNGWDDGAKI